MSEPITKRTILITGATDGIGKALAEHYSTKGWQSQPARLIFIGRRSLIDASTIDPTLFTADSYCQANLAELESAESIVTWLREKQITQIDLLIHNAGIGYVGRAHDQPADNIRQLINVNLRTPIALTHHLLPHLKNATGQTHNSKIVFISSVAATLPTPHYAVYTATKAALDGFVRNLQIELAADPATQTLRAQLISPGATRTNMHAKSGADLDPQKFPTAQKVAAKIVATIDTNRRTKTIGPFNQLLKFTGKHAAFILDPLVRIRTIRTTQSTQTQQQPASIPQPNSVEKAADHLGTCTITGAADGIGKALALRFATSGYAIKGIDIDADRSATTETELRDSGAEATFLVANLLDPADLERTQINLAAGPSITTLVHNAGINAVGHFAQLDLASQLRVLDLNFTAPLLLTADLLSANKLQPGGSIIFLSSLSHYVSYPGAAVYAATKDGIASYARSLSAALAIQKINVLTVFPGPTRTAHARRYSPDNSRENNRMSPDELAQQIVNATAARRRILIPGSVNRIFATLGRIAPRAMEFAMRKTLLDKLE